MGLGLALPPTSSPVSAPANPNRLPEDTVVDGGMKPSPEELEDFDDYDDGAIVDEAPKLRLLDPPRDAPSVIVEAVGDVFEVSRLRDNGTTVACVMWTRKELEELIRRAQSALEM